MQVSKFDIIGFPSIVGYCISILFAVSQNPLWFFIFLPSAGGLLLLVLLWIADQSNKTENSVKFAEEKGEKQKC